MKQALMEGALRLPNLNVYEQGSGRINLPNAQKVLAEYTPRASLIPAALDFTQCPYMWPFCKQPFYAFAMPVMFNATILNGMGVTGTVVEGPTFTPSNDGGKLLHVSFEHSALVWPWSGYLAVYIQVGGWVVAAAAARPGSAPIVGACVYCEVHVVHRPCVAPPVCT